MHLTPSWVHVHFTDPYGLFATDSDEHYDSLCDMGSHYVHLIQEFGAPNGLCSSITESHHITAVKKPWCCSNHYEPLGQILLTNQRFDKLAVACAHFIAHGMLPEEQMTATTPKPVRNERDDGAIDGDILGEITLPLRPRKCIPSLTSHMKLISESRVQFPHRYRVASRTP